MKKKLLLFIALFSATTLFAQWTLVNNGLSNFPPTTLSTYGDTIALGTFGGGIFKTLDNGESWIDITGDLGNKFVNSLVTGWNGPGWLFVSTKGGPYFSMDQVTYENCTSTGLTTTDVTFFSSGEDQISDDFMIGTNGGGMFSSGDYNGPWTPFNTGLSGNGLIVNDFYHYDDNNVNFFALASDNGVYLATDVNPTWVAKSNGLTGDALSVQGIAGLGTALLIATKAGLYITTDLCETWTPLLPNEVLKGVTIVNSPLSATGFFMFTYGENGFYSEDFMNWTPIDMGGVPAGATINCMTANSTHLYIGVETAKKSTAITNGGLYNKPISQVVGLFEIGAQEPAGRLSQNFPNPFKQLTQLTYTLENRANVCIKVSDLCGREVQSYVNSKQDKGKHTLMIDAGTLNNGIYYYTLLINEIQVESKRMLIAK